MAFCRIRTTLYEGKSHQRELAVPSVDEVVIYYIVQQ